MSRDTHPSDPTSPFAHKKSLGQNFLTSDVVPKWLYEAAQLKPSDLILEIGPGTGRLTKELLAHGHTVVAVEADERAIAILEAEYADDITSGKLILQHRDARTLDLAGLGFTDHQYAVVANIPYYLSGLLLRQLLETPIQPHTLVFLMQKELVERIARSTKESLLSLSVKAFGDPTYVKTVSRGHFNPSPKVDSAILAVRNISRDRLSHLDQEFFFSLLHAGLGSKRKQLIGNLSQHYSREHLLQYFVELNLKPTVRGEDVPLATWVALAQKIQSTAS
jgi:16S rRNA (adenine1518-N6/adenine1519-N6)-dimethyltransferase